MSGAKRKVFLLLGISLAVFCGCLPLSFSLKQNIPSRIRVRGEAEALLRIDDPSRLSRIAKEEARQDAVEKMYFQIRKMYVTPFKRAGEMMDENSQLKMEVIKLIGQSRERKMGFSRGNRVSVQLELEGDKLRELFSPHK